MEEVSCETPRTKMPKPKNMIKNTEGEGVVVVSPSKAKEPSEEGSGWWVVTIIAYGVEISTAGGVGEMICAHLLHLFGVSYIGVLSATILIQ